MTSVRLTTNLDWLAPELCDVIRLFMGDVPISAEEGELTVSHTHAEVNGRWIETAADGARTFTAEVEAVHGGLIEKRVLKRAAKTAVFKLMCDIHSFCPPWGSLTGIRPTRLMYEAMEEGMTEEQAAKRLETEFFVSHEKAELLREIIEMQKGFIFPPEDTFDLYIGIPFCVTRCAYCSFASGEIGDGRLTEPYTNAIIHEIRKSAELMRELGLHLRAGYMGGGTPTAISADQMDRILTAARECFPGAVEWTVEAGRPDTITNEKLDVLIKHGIERISVNPQTFSDATLRAIGRAHSAEDTLRAYALAREKGFHHINMDIIAALPGEDIAAFEKTVDKCIELSPESITVHSLAIKRSSRLHEQLTVAGDSHCQANAADADRMIRMAREKLHDGGWHPYYLYRQKYMAGNLENVGYAKKGYACLYNIGNMEETAKVLALGAGAITKWVFDRERRIERAPNLRNIEEYIARVDEMCERKRKVILEDDK